MKIKLSIVFVALTMLSTAATTFAHSPAFTDTFRQQDCKFASKGRNPFFILEPGYEVVLEGEEDGEQVRLVITVLDETKIVDGVETRVVREKESHDGEIVEISRNFFAICRPTNSVFYFGESVDIFENGNVSHEGSWRAGTNGARAGIIMPGTLLIGSRFFQEVAPDVALDRAEIISLDESVKTPFGEFQGCLKTKETTPLEPDATEFKFYAPGVGLVKEQNLKLTSISTPTGTLYPQH